MAHMPPEVSILLIFMHIFVMVQFFWGGSTENTGTIKLQERVMQITSI
jgi:hypothetical protein